MCTFYDIIIIIIITNHYRCLQMSQRTHLFVKQKYTQARACPVYRLVRVRSSTEMKYDYENDDDYESIRQYQSNPD